MSSETPAGPVLCRDLVIPEKGHPSSNGGKPFPFFIAEDGIKIERLGRGLAKVTLTILVRGVTVMGDADVVIREKLPADVFASTGDSDKWHAEAIDTTGSD